MPTMQRTRDRERVARTLSERFKYVLIRNKNLTWNPIRLRRKKIADLNPYIVMNAPAFDAQLQAWNESGGVLIYDRSHRSHENIASHHAQLVSECPPTLDLLRGYTLGTRDLAVIYEPPNWREHEQLIENWTPGAARCRALYELVMSAPEDPRTRQLGLRTCRALSPQLACATMGITKAQLSRVRSTTFRTRDFLDVTRVVLRVEPDDAHLAGVYRYIAENFPAERGEYLIVGKQLMCASRHWKDALKRMERHGNIALKEPIMCFFMEGAGPDFTRLQQDHERARAQLQDVRDYVETLEEI